MNEMDFETLMKMLPEVEDSPSDSGSVEMIVIRPDIDQRRVVESCKFSTSAGAAGDSWLNRYQEQGEEPIRDTQVAIMNSRVARLIAGDRMEWPQAGDTLFVDFDLSAANLPSGQLIAIGEVHVRVSSVQHTGCAKFAERFGPDAIRLINSEKGVALRLRGIFASVERPGIVHAGDSVRKIEDGFE